MKARTIFEGKPFRDTHAHCENKNVNKLNNNELAKLTKPDVPNFKPKMKAVKHAQQSPATGSPH